ncbi:hypothetical protein ACFH04_13410 [Streptomyces noboritoensis]|uniref:Uncharacterized protein n=1 Tax=Streptomyces noboritoensis TaxID=67337 RepID=A0ABV6TFY1_9ACTN
MTRTIRRTASMLAALALGAAFAWTWVNSHVAIEPQAGDTNVTAAWINHAEHEVL